MNNKPVMTYEDSVHLYGRIFMWTSGILLLAFPAAICLWFDAWPPLNGVFKGLLSVAPVFWTVGIIEDFTFIPMLGAGGTYVGFVTGNLTNLKAPCALNAMELAGVKPGSQEGEAVATLAIAVSAIVTTLIIILGVILIAPLTPILDSEVLQPAFDNILPALFGGLAVVFVAKNIKIAVVPLAVMLAIFICIPAASGAVSLLIPVGVAVAIGAARWMYKRGMLD